MRFTTHWLAGQAGDTGLAPFVPHHLTVLLTCLIILNALALIMGGGAERAEAVASRLLHRTHPAQVIRSDEC